MSASLGGRPPKFVVDDFPLSISCRPLSIRGIGIDRKFRWADFGQERDLAAPKCSPRSRRSLVELISAKAARARSNFGRRHREQHMGVGSGFIVGSCSLLRTCSYALWN